MAESTAPTAGAASDPRYAIHPDRVRAVLDGRLSDATVARLLACARLRERIDACLARAHGLPGRLPSADAAPAWLLSNPAETARRAGAVLHGRVLRSVVSGPDVAALVAAIGRDAHALGLRHGADAAPRENGGDLVGAILRDGEACLGAWLRRQPAPVRAAVLIALPPGTPIEAGAEPADMAPDAVMAVVARSYAGADPSPTESRDV